MKYLQYLAITAGILVAFFTIAFVLTSFEAARGWTFAIALPALWTARLIVALRRGEISRRMKMLDGGPPAAGLFFSFRPEVYVRAPGFDNFKGYFFKEACCCLLVWVMILSIFVVSIIEQRGVMG